jgi:hypothetical protein
VPGEQKTLESLCSQTLEPVITACLQEYAYGAGQGPRGGLS